MNDSSASAHFIDIDQISIGMFVILELSWLQHPFAFNSFVIQSEAEIKTLRELGLKKIRTDPLRSKLIAATTSTPASSSDSPETVVPSATGNDTISAEKLARREQNLALRNNIASAEKQASHTASQIRQSAKQFYSDPPRAIAGTESLINSIAETLLANSDVMVHLLNDKVGGEEIYHHALNVTMLALLLGKAMAYDAATLQNIGMAAVFHDIGKEEIPSRVLLKTEPWTHAEEMLVRDHVQKGAEAAARGGLPPAVIAGILQHHENLDGTGYPHHPPAEKIGPVPRLIAIVNHYDNLCNPVNVANALTPYEALSTMFAKRKGWFDNAMLSKLVQILGVYPPGSIVRLSNGATGMVISVNSARPLKPLVLVHDASIPKEEALIIDLDKEPGLIISKSLRPSTLAPSVHAYLSPRKRTTYFFGDGSNSG